MSATQKLKDLACSVIDSQAPQLKDLSKDIWEHPELYYNEHYAHKTLTNFLRERGFAVECSYKLETAFRAEQRSSGDEQRSPNVAVLCEYDALPQIGHACGHNLIATVGVGASLGIQAALLSSEYTGTGMLTVLGTPAEEGGGGKIDLIQAGAFQDVDLAMMVHPSQLNLSSPLYLAANEVEIEYRGKAAHASSYPWNGVNALDAAVMCYTNISHLRQQMKPTWRALGIITNGGAKPNIIPDTSGLLYSVRATTDSELAIVNKKVAGCIEGAALATGCSVEYQFSKKPYSSLLSNPTMASLYTANAEKLGIAMETDPEKLQKLRGSTDMGNVSHVVPSIHPNYNIGTTASAHTPEFAAQAKTSEAEDSSLTVAKALAMTAIDFLTTPELVQQARMEFEKAVMSESLN
ncbi:hypothetical protein BaRGS_00020993 [Batillaria attramentaria]|uniref:Peptidase M20 domain-containing protein 2 n=1 Tax=Batillaria attramentaria TaxID=370345 RepID=A0ABD0KKW6_9CAEN